MTDEEQKLHDEYGYLQWHKQWLREEIIKADEKQREIKELLNNL
jgi:hypothetical protein